MLGVLVKLNEKEAEEQCRLAIKESLEENKTEMATCTI